MRFVLLALLAAGPAHGYELKQTLERLLGPAYPPHNIGQIYVTLRRLEKSGLIEGEHVVQSHRPNRRSYRITESGRRDVAAWFEQPIERPRVRDEFFMKLALASRSGLADRLSLIAAQRQRYRSRLRELSRLADDLGQDDRVEQLLVEGAILHLQADLEWLERCAEELG